MRGGARELEVVRDVRDRHAVVRAASERSTWAAREINLDALIAPFRDVPDRTLPDLQH